MYQVIVAETDRRKEKMIASGNGIRKNIWLQRILSQKFHMSVQLAEYEEEAAVGAVRSAELAEIP